LLDVLERVATEKVDGLLCTTVGNCRQYAKHRCNRQSYRERETGTSL